MGYGRDEGGGRKGKTEARREERRTAGEGNSCPHGHF